VFFDAIRVKIMDQGFVRNKAIYIALGILPDGTKELLGIWIEQTEGAKFWMRVMNELRNRGIADILIAVVDGLKGFPDAINAVFPETVVQTCIVHLIRGLQELRLLEGPEGRRKRAQERLSRRECRRRAWPHWTPSTRASGARNTQPSCRAGADTGSR